LEAAEHERDYIDAGFATTLSTDGAGGDEGGLAYEWTADELKTRAHFEALDADDNNWSGEGAMIPVGAEGSSQNSVEWQALWESEDESQKKTASELEMQEHFEALDAAPAAGVDRALAAAPAAEVGQLGGGVNPEDPLQPRKAYLPGIDDFFFAAAPSSLPESFEYRFWAKAWRSGGSVCVLVLTVVA